MVAPGRTLSKSQKRELRAWLSKTGVQYPDRVLLDPNQALTAWSDYQASKVENPAELVELVSPVLSPALSAAPVPAKVPAEVPAVLKHGRGPGRRSAGDLYSVRLPPDLLHEYRMLSLVEDCSVSTLVRKAMRAYLAGRA